ncbi:general odorant-binding protein 99a-like [Sitodiplosis mosellana]|uniref:general odorant-binding protein 99a-like n=1 Tax=Sitodiplosis mosellana TaxID=263140 RepID=UPI002443DC21|nr:general odorant-binding protein 99a-like [Sitodiplosis mosellana]
MQLIATAIFLAFVGFCWSVETNADIFSEHLKWQETLGTARRECQTTLHVSEDAVREHGLGNRTNSEATQCFAKCIFTKLGMFNETNGFNEDSSIDRFRVAMVAKEGNIPSIREIVVKCASKKIKTENACGWANRGFECFRKEGLSLG